MNPEFVDHPVRPGFVVVDAVQNRRVPFVADRPVERTPVDTDAFRFPVSNAIAVDASTFSLPYRTGGFVRTADGVALAEIDHRTDRAFEPGRYLLEIDAPVKLYLLVDGEFRIETTDDSTRFHFSDAVRIGARSYHETPDGTITVTDDPLDVMAAISLLSSSLKDLSPERSFPTLRGHPPRIEFGDEFSVPDGVERPETGVTIELPPEPEYLLPVASLAFYLGADLEPACHARLTTDAGFAYDLEPDRGFQAEVARVLKQLFTLDCVVRTEGLYPVDLHERNLLAERVDLDFADLYDRSIVEQLEAYLALDYEAVADAEPKWCLTVDCRPELRHADYLPFVVNHLGIIRTQASEMVESHPEMEREVAEFARSPEFTRGAASSRVETRGAADESPQSVIDKASYVELLSADSINHAWIGEEWPHNGDKLLKAGYENALTRYDEEDDDDHIDVTVVCNDDRMRKEYEGKQLYGNRDELEFSVETHKNTTVSELRRLLTGGSDFFHYIGHVEDYEFVCEDGGLDVRELDAAGPRLFLLNGCTSFEQGRKLVEAGSIAGIVTRSDIGNKSAVTIGQQIARLLNRGFPIGSALSLVQEQTLTSNQYLTLGDTCSGFVHTDSIFPLLHRLRKTGRERYSLRMECYPDARESIGGIFSPFLSSADKFALVPAEYPEVDNLREDTFKELFGSASSPMIYHGDLSWEFE